MLVDFYCPQCGRSYKSDEVKYDTWYDDVNAGGNAVCPEDGEILEEQVDVCDICGKELKKGEHSICTECCEKYASIKNIKKLFEYNEVDQKERMKFLTDIIGEDDIEKILFDKLEEAENGVFADDLKNDIVRYLKAHDDLFTDSECAVVEELE